MGFDFYLKSALRNIRNNKRQASILVFSIFISISLPIAIKLWAFTAEDLAAQDFLEEQDFEMRIIANYPDELPFIIEWLKTDPLVKEIYKLHDNVACFNAENKPWDYRWGPENDQEDMSDPLSYTSLGLFPQISLERIKSQFYIRGSFDIGYNECLISEHEALELERIYGYPIEPGMNFTLSVAKDSPEMGQFLLHHLDLIHYQNVTIKGIYRPIPGITMLQKTYSANFLRDSVIFLRENLDNFTLLEMEANGVLAKIMLKANIDVLKANGIDQILNKLNDLADRLEVTFVNSNSIILDSLIKELLESYTLAQSTVVFMIPVIATSIILMLFTVNIIIEKRKEHFITLKDRGGQNWQIIIISLLEFLFLILIAYFLGICSSFIISAFIPTIASGSFSGAIFKLFILNVQFPFTLALYLGLGAILVISVFIFIKMYSILGNKLEERTAKRRERLQIAAIISSILIILGFTIGFLLKITIENQQEIKNLYTFNVEQSQRSMRIFLLIITLIIALVVIVTIALNANLGKIKWLYKQLFQNNSFFVSNTLKSSKNKLTILLIVFILISSFNVFSMNIYQTLKENEEAVQYYNNGSDLRIQTTYVDIDFANNLSQIEGIDEVMPITKAYGKPIYTKATIYGIDPIAFLRIGRWDTAYENQTEIINIMNYLNQTDNGAIISDYIANRHNIAIGDQLIIAELPNTTATGSYESFTIQGIIKTAPGLGLAYGVNLELFQPYDEFILINIRTMINKYAVRDTNLFFANIKPNYSIETIEEELLKFGDVIEINPEIINHQFVGEYVNQYIPNAKVFLLIQLILMNFIGLIIITLSLDFILKQRNQNHAILNSLGNSNTNLSHLIVSELLVIEIASFISAIVLSIPIAYFSTIVNRSSFFTHNILPIEYTVSYFGILGYIVILLLLSIIMTLPMLGRFSKKNIAKILREV